MARAEVALRSITNLRDVGGCRTPSGRVVRSGLLFRSDSLHKLQGGDVEAVIRGCAPRSIVDLRSAEEVLRYGVGPLPPRVRHVHVPVGVDAPGTLRGTDRLVGSLLDVYMRLAEDSGREIAKLIRVLAARDTLPTILFCAAGKDRTGVVIALLLGALNVRDDDIVIDYALTAPVDPTQLGEGYAERLANHPRSFLEAAPETMQGFLASIRRRHGSIRAYLTRHGVRRDELSALERALLVRD